MPVFFNYSDATRGTETTINGNPVNYNFTPPSGNWRWTGNSSSFTVRENDGASVFNGDSTNETISPNERLGGVWEQVAEVDGTFRQLIWDYTFEVSLGTDTYRIGVIDVDLNNDNDLNDAGEDGYFLVFVDGPPPINTDLTVGNIVENDDFSPHGDLGAEVVCFASGTPIDTPFGPRAVQDLRAGDPVQTRDGGVQSILWRGTTRVPARGALAPVEIEAGALGNTESVRFSPQHAVLLTGWKAELYFGAPEVLVRAIDLVGQPGITQCSGGWVSYHHILLDAHHLVRSRGLWSESLYPGEFTREAISKEASEELALLFPTAIEYGPKAARCLKQFEATCLRG